MAIAMLDVKLLRDFRRLSMQALAIALVLASGIATLILAGGAYRSLEESRAAYYERNAFADVFASMTRAPLSAADRMRAIDGVRAVESRIVRHTLLDVPNLAEPATGLAMSLPDHREQRLNRLHLREGRLPEPGRVDEVVVSEAFALAHRFRPGSTFGAVLNGHKRTLSIVGTALSPEFIYAIGPGDLMPDDRRFAVLWMSEKALGGLFRMEGAFNNVAVTLAPGAVEPAVLAEIDALLAPYGGTGAYGRKDQQSHAFIEAELKQLAALARVIPPIFLAVSAFLINITLSRLIALEREQIGLLKAIGYSSSRIALHYTQLVVLIAAAGMIIGFTAGTLLGGALTRLYGDFFRFPYLVFSNDPGTYAIAGAVALAAAILGAARAVREVLALAPAVAMQPPAPPRFSHMPHWWPSWRIGLSPVTVMTFRRMVRSPVRSGFTVLGLAFAVALLVTALQSFDSVEAMVDVAFNRTDRQHATLNFTEAQSPRALEAVARLPGVLRAEPYRAAPVKLGNGAVSRRFTINGKPPGMDLSRVLDLDLNPVAMPAGGLVVGERVAEILGLRRGDAVQIMVLEGKRGTLTAPVTDIIKSYFGLTVFMDLAALDALLDEGPRLSGVHVTFDASRADELFAAVKRTPAVASIALQRHALVKFRETIAQNISYMVTVYVTLAVVIAFGIVYNSARIQLSERGRELASLRVLGFTRAEVRWVLLGELAVETLLALPLGWLIGTGFAWLVIQGFSSDLYRAPFVIEQATYATAALVVLAAAGLSSLIVRRRIDRLDLIAVLKTRE